MPQHTRTESSNSNSPRTYDIIVVGAGPAGSMAAWHAAKGGRRVCLLERKQKTGIPVRCGEGIGFKGLTASVELDPSWILTTIKRARFISPGGIRVDLENIEKSFVLNREIMDNALKDRAIEAGAAFHAGTPVLSVRRDDMLRYVCVTPVGEFAAACIILADGVESALARACGWNTRLALEDLESCAFCHVAHDSIEDNTACFYVGSSYAPAGFVWIFPRAKGVGNVGLGLLGSKCEGGAPKMFLHKFIESQFPGAQVSNLHCGGVPVARWQKPLVRDGIMLAGDAARQVNCLSGEGIGYSMFAGKCAGEVAARAFDGTHCRHAMLNEYQKKWASFLGKQQIRSYVLKTVLLEQGNDTYLEELARNLKGIDPKKMGYMRVFLRTFARHPLLLLKVFLLFRK